jgi:chalcone isomerase-like protein
MRIGSPAALFLLTTVLVAGEAAGVKMPDSVTVEGKTLRLNGLGLRKKMLFKVYVAGLYLETASNAPSTIVASDQVKQMRLHVLRHLKASQVTEAIEEGFEKNSKTQMGALKERLKRFGAMFSDVADGDPIWMTYAPGKGVTVSIKGTEKGTVEGKDFADALFSVWLGPDPVQEDLKKALLGG